MFAKFISKNSYLDDSDTSLPAFLSTANLRQHDISGIPKLVKSLITNRDSSKTYSPDCIPVMVLKKFEPELSYGLSELFNMCLKEYCFPDCLKVWSVVPVFENYGERSMAKNYCPVTLLSVGSKNLEKLVNNRLVNYLTKCGLFLFPVWFQVFWINCRSSDSCIWKNC